MIWLRRLLGALALGMALASGWQAVALWRGGGWWVERAEENLEQVYARVMARVATPVRIAALIETRLAETPRNWHVIEALLAESTPVPPKLQASITAARAEDFSPLAKLGACWACSYDLSQCTLGPDLVCGLSVNLTFAGDLLVLGREGLALGQGAEVDGLDVTLAFIGLGATALVVATGGTSYTVKAGAGLVRVAHRMGRLAPDLRRVYTRAFREGIDWAAVSRGVPLVRATRADALTPAMRLSDDLGIMLERTGSAGTLHLLGAATTVPEARSLARTARVLGPRSTTALEVLGKSRVMRLGLRVSNEVFGVLAALGAALSLLGSLSAGWILRRVRRML